MDYVLEPGRASGNAGRDVVGKRLAEDPSGARGGGAPEPAHLDPQVDGPAVRGEIGQLPIIPAMDLRRPPAALRAGRVGSARSGHNQQTVGLSGDGFNEKTGRRDRLM